MTGVLFAFLKTDLLAIRGWFLRQGISKLLVALSFFSLFILVAKVIYSLAFLYFRSFSVYEEFGLLVSSYLVNASLVILSWFILVTTLTSMLTFLLTKNPQTEFLLTLPIKPTYLQIWIFFRAALINSWLLLITLLPIMLAFADVFLKGVSLKFIFGLVFVIFVLVCLAGSFGGLLAFAIARFVKNRGLAFAVAAAFVFLIVFLLLIEIIFPKQIFLLSSTSLEGFWSIYKSLPLNNAFLPSYWLTQIVLGKLDYLPPLIILSLATVSFSIFVQAKDFSSLFQTLQEYSHRPMQFSDSKLQEKLAKSKLPIVLKDWLSIVRSPAEVSYAIVFILFGVIFFSLLSLGEKFRIPEGAWEKELVLFSFAWLAFFTTAYLLRVIFPLMAREGPSAWFIFSLPIGREKIVLAKLFLGFMLSIPQAILAIFIWNFVASSGIYDLSLPVLSFQLVFFLVVIISLLGSLNPNFQDGNSPEKISTSLTGLASLLISVVFTGIYAFFLHGILNQKISFSLALALLIVISSQTAFVLAIFARNSSKNYQF